MSDLRDARLAQLAAYQQSADAVVADMIRDELREGLAVLEEAREVRAQALDEAAAALAPAQEAVDVLQGEVAAVQDRRAGLIRERDMGGTADQRIQARLHLQAVEAELESLTSKLNAASEILSPLLAAHRKAEQELEAAQGKVDQRKANIALPFYGDGQLTSSYVKFRQGSGWLSEILLTGDPGHGEWGSALQQMAVLSTVSGFRTEGRDDVPDEALRARKNWEAISAGYDHSPGAGGALDMSKNQRANQPGAVPVQPQRGQQGPSEPSVYRAGESASRIYDRYVN